MKEDKKKKEEAGATPGEPELARLEKVSDIPNVLEVPVKINGRETDFKGIVREEDDFTYSIVSNDYQLVEHGRVWEKITDVAKENDYSIVKAELYRYGRAMCVELNDTEPMSIEIFKGDEIQRGIRIFNSYDKSKALSVESFGLRLVCKNGMVAPGFVKRYSRTHSYNNINIDDMSKYMELGMEAWATTAKVLRASAKIMLEPEPVVKKLDFPVKYETDIIGKIEMEGDKASVYEIWNSITNVITHGMSDNVQTKRLLKYQRRANSVFDYVGKEVAIATTP